MAVPAHDERDFEFAKKYDLPIIKTICSPEEYREYEKAEEIYDETENPEILNIFDKIEDELPN
jgi:leucine--tRNA ligase